MSHKNFGEKEAKIFSGMNPFTLSKLKSIDFAEKINVHRVSELMHVWFTFKGTAKKIWRCPVNQLKLFAVQEYYADDF